MKGEDEVVAEFHKTFKEKLLSFLLIFKNENKHFLEVWVYLLYFILFYACIYVYVPHECLIPMEVRGGIRSLTTGVISSCELPY